jgi:diphthamide synthase (EF-2-diphthine--ammonia ligase)
MEADLYDFKIDSVVREIFRAKDFPDEKLASYSKSKDSLGFINELAPLSKKVYYPYLDLTLEYRDSYNAHRRYQIIVCYNKEAFVGIPFYWQRINDSLKLNLFENKLNRALKIFYNHDKHGTFLQFQRKIVNSIFKDISIYRILPLWASDSTTLIKKMGRLNHETQCIKNATESIRKIYQDKDEETEYFVLPINDCQLKIEYTKNGVELTVINSSCFFELIF